MTEIDTRLRARVSPGTQPRGLALRLEMEPERDWARPSTEDWPYDIPVPPAPRSPEEHVGAFLAAIEPGFFDYPGGADPAPIRARRTEHKGVMVCEMVAPLPAISLAGVGCLLRSVLEAGGAWGLTSLAAEELNAAGAREVSSVDELPRVSVPRAPFELAIDRLIEQQVVVEIELQDDVGDVASARLASISRSWGMLIESGAFRGALGMPWCVGRLESANESLANEWIITVDGYLGDREVVAPLVGALALLHERHPIASVLIRSSS